MYSLTLSLVQEKKEIREDMLCERRSFWDNSSLDVHNDLSQFVSQEVLARIDSLKENFQRRLCSGSDRDIAIGSYESFGGEVPTDVLNLVLKSSGTLCLPLVLDDKIFFETAAIAERLEGYRISKKNSRDQCLHENLKMRHLRQHHHKKQDGCSSSQKDTDIVFHSPGRILEAEEICCKQERFKKEHENSCKPIPGLTGKQVYPDIIILPGVAFTKKGHRLGRGGGHYDRYLSSFSEFEQRPYTIGLCYDFQIVNALPLESHDEIVDEVIVINTILQNSAQL